MLFQFLCHVLEACCIFADMVSGDVCSEEPQAQQNIFSRLSMVDLLEREHTALLGVLDALFRLSGICRNRLCTNAGEAFNSVWPEKTTSILKTSSSTILC